MLNWLVWRWRRYCRRSLRMPEVGSNSFVDWVHIHCCGNGCLGFRPYGGSLSKSVYGPDTWLTGRRDQRPPRGGLTADLDLPVVHPSDLWEQSLLAKTAAHLMLMQAVTHCYREQARSHREVCVGGRIVGRAVPMCASLLAIAVGQSQMHPQTEHHREQTQIPQGLHKSSRHSPHQQLICQEHIHQAG